MYGQSSLLIVSVLLVTMLASIEAGYRLGRRSHAGAEDARKAKVSAVQTSLLGILALLLGFTFSLALQRFDSRSEAIVDEANAIGTAYLRAQLLPAGVSGRVLRSLREYVDLRIREGGVSLASEAERERLLDELRRVQQSLWREARLAVEEDPRPVTSGLFVQALNELIDSFERRDATLDRHVPEVVLFLLYGVFLMTGGVVGYSSGVDGHRTPFVTYIMVVLIVLLVFIIIDLDRPRRGLIEVNQRSLHDLQRSMSEPADTKSKLD